MAAGNDGVAGVGKEGAAGGRAAEAYNNAIGVDGHATGADGEAIVVDDDTMGVDGVDIVAKGIVVRVQDDVHRHYLVMESQVSAEAVVGRWSRRTCGSAGAMARAGGDGVSG